MLQKIADMTLKFGKKSSYDGDNAQEIMENFHTLSKQRTKYFISKMFDAVNTRNVLRMEEILKRFTQSKDDCDLQDDFGNSLVTLAIIN